MAQISVKIPDSIYLEMERNVNALHVSKNQFVNDALKEYNLRLKMKSYAKEMKEDSLHSRDLMKTELADLDDFVGDQG